jgi:hypothetical protein
MSIGHRICMYTRTLGGKSPVMLSEAKHLGISQNKTLRFAQGDIIVPAGLASPKVRPWRMTCRIKPINGAPGK